MALKQVHPVVLCLLLPLAPAQVPARSQDSHLAAAPPSLVHTLPPPSVRLLELQLEELLAARAAFPSERRRLSFGATQQARPLQLLPLRLRHLLASILHQAQPQVLMRVCDCVLFAHPWAPKQCASTQSTSKPTAFADNLRFRPVLNIGTGFCRFCWYGRLLRLLFRPRACWSLCVRRSGCYRRRGVLHSSHQRIQRWGIRQRGCCACPCLWRHHKCRLQHRVGLRQRLLLCWRARSLLLWCPRRLEHGIRLWRLLLCWRALSPRLWCPRRHGRGRCERRGRRCVWRVSCILGTPLPPLVVKCESHLSVPVCAVLTCLCSLLTCQRALSCCDEATKGSIM